MNKAGFSLLGFALIFAVISSVIMFEITRNFDSLLKTKMIYRRAYLAQSASEDIAQKIKRAYDLGVMVKNKGSQCSTYGNLYPLRVGNLDFCFPEGDELCGIDGIYCLKTSSIRRAVFTAFRERNSKFKMMAQALLGVDVRASQESVYWPEDPRSAHISNAMVLDDCEDGSCYSCGKDLVCVSYEVCLKSGLTCASVIEQVVGFPEKTPSSCKDLVEMGFTADGNYTIILPDRGPTEVYCKMNPSDECGAGWMLVYSQNGATILPDDSTPTAGANYPKNPEERTTGRILPSVDWNDDMIACSPDGGATVHRLCFKKDNIVWDTVRTESSTCTYGLKPIEGSGGAGGQANISYVEKSKGTSGGPPCGNTCDFEKRFRFDGKTPGGLPVTIGVSASSCGTEEPVCGNVQGANANMKFWYYVR
ncbi:MAG: hypothetical protein OM95_05015 [Bdellovibrio sp. ArHS]|uniref:hypothetical protein n=1 Tax=Bdellovibrio sp. ArHS TaxID=1569284 RepID=UPI000583DF0D|nr:hypothetical protein [Bdellovibrio sp. ArHS]KHD89180.1 MAG: hypothetical protein OM95_05015 [Bdellovibrio sp. ArHS]